MDKGEVLKQKIEHMLENSEVTFREASAIFVSLLLDLARNSPVPEHTFAILKMAIDAGWDEILRRNIRN